ncbi:hypothetical protein L1049_014540 [Liquidambar formosana]|uniref:DDE Tnp4 domain-containing protein n=1 Tax=Liquidambar formosana TaxID=63359 RepID=A0AAP0RW68_LIQFO
MARLMVSKKKEIRSILESIRSLLNVISLFHVWLYLLLGKHYEDHVLKSESYFTHDSRMLNLHNIIFHNDTTCISQLRMNRYTFFKLCGMLRTIGKLKDTRHVTMEEITTLFVHILAHHVKNRVIINRFMRSGETISRHFNEVLKGVIRLQSHLLKQPEAVTETSTDPKWKWFKNCMGALDGTYIRINVPEVDKPRYRTRKNDIATNVLGEGSAADSRVLRDAVSRRHGLKVPRGFYYLVDTGYPNGEGFLAPYRGQRYHLNDWRTGYQPTTPQEFFNMKHSSARNVIERCFGLLKRRWAILRSPSFYPVQTHNWIILACVLLHNHITREMPTDPFRELPFTENFIHPQGEPLEYVDASDQWQTWRNTMATEMFNEWMATTSVDKDSTASIAPRVGKHQWTPSEDAKLVESLYELYSMGTWKCDTSFKSCYLVQLEKMLATKIPAAGLRACPHIESRTHPAAKGLFRKPFPHYDTLIEIFGKDRANGLGATTPAAEEEAIEASAANDFNGTTHFEDGFEGIEVSSTQPQPSQSGTSLGKRNAISEESILTKQISEEVQKIEGLSLLDVLKVGKDISKDLYMSNVFLSLPDAKRKEMVSELLKGRNPTN